MDYRNNNYRNNNYQAPTFTPPTPTFTPPSARQQHGPVCYYHNDQLAAGSCAKCNANLCEDCCDSYGVSTGEYAGYALCYDCTQELVAENVELLKKQRSKIILSIVGTLIGVLFGLAAFTNDGPIAMIIGAAWFGSIWVCIKATFSGWWNNPQGRSIMGFVGSFIGVSIVAPFITIKKMIQYIIYMVKTSSFINDDNQALEQMRDYMDYTIAMSRNRGVDLETLMEHDSALYNNSFVQMVRAEGEQQATARIRQCATMIAENGEIIRSFAA